MILAGLIVRQGAKSLNSYDMKQSTINARRCEFRRAILAAGIDAGADFFTLPASDLARLADLAKSFHYRRPASFPGCLARAFFYSAQMAKF